MAFVLPSDYSVATAPVPLDPAVLIKEIPGKKVAVIRYSGSLSEQAIEEKSEELKNWLSQQGFRALSPSRSAAYDPPGHSRFFVVMKFTLILSDYEYRNQKTNCPLKLIIIGGGYAGLSALITLRKQVPMPKLP